MNYSVIVFDTAPTGHTLRLLSFPSILDKALSKVMAIKDRFSGLFTQFQSMMGTDMPSEDIILNKLNSAKQIIETVNQQFQDDVRFLPVFFSIEVEKLLGCNYVCLCLHP